MISGKAIALAVVAGVLVGLAGGVVVQGWRMSGQVQQARAELAQAKADHNEVLLRQSAAALESYTRMEAEKDAAIKNSEALAARNGADAAATRRERDGLRDELAGVPARIATASRAAVDEYAAAATVVFEQCTARYSELAEKAQGHAADVKLMLDAWPRTSTSSGLGLKR